MPRLFNEQRHVVIVIVVAFSRTAYFIHYARPPEKLVVLPQAQVLVLNVRRRVFYTDFRTFFFSDSCKSRPKFLREAGVSYTNFSTKIFRVIRAKLKPKFLVLVYVPCKSQAKLRYVSCKSQPKKI